MFLKLKGNRYLFFIFRKNKFICIYRCACLVAMFISIQCTNCCNQVTMCCWSVKVTVTVTGNLVLRVCAELTDVVCKLLVAWWCASSNQAQKSSVNLASIQSCPWYSNIDRKTSESILKELNFNGAFLIRPSSNPNNVCTLSVLQNGQPFHINVRQRPDGWLALGTSKPNEHCFATVQDIVEFYKKETLVINSCGEKYLTVLQEQSIVINECMQVMNDS